MSLKAPLAARLASALACQVVAFKMGGCTGCGGCMCLKTIVFYDVYGCNQAENASKNTWLHRKPRKYLRKRTRNHCNHPAVVSVVAAMVWLHLLGLACQGATSVLWVVAWVVAHKSS